MRDPSYDVCYQDSLVIRKIYLELTDRCNLDCSFCYRSGWDLPEVDMKEETFQRFLTDLEAVEGLEKIVLGGIGEPTYHPKILQILDRLAGYHLHMTTNGTLLGKRLRAKLIERVDTITVSVDGGRESFQKLRGTDLNQVIRNLEALEAEKKAAGSLTPRLEIQFVANTENIGEIYSVIDLASHLNATRVIMSNLLPQSEEFRDKIIYAREKKPEQKQLLNSIYNYSSRRGMAIQLPPLHLKTERYCRFIEDVAAYLTADGHVVPCYRLSHHCAEYVFGRRKNVARYSFGSIDETDLLSIWNRDDYRRFRFRVYSNRYPSCIDCDLLDGCDIPVALEEDCHGNAPSCSDCLWARRIVVCP